MTSGNSVHSRSGGGEAGWGGIRDFRKKHMGELGREGLEQSSLIRFFEFCQITPGRDRTCDPRFRKPMLYPLSYGGERVRPGKEVTLVRPGEEAAFQI